MTRALVLAADHKRWNLLPWVRLRACYVLLRRRMGVPTSWAIAEATGIVRLCEEAWRVRE